MLLDYHSAQKKPIEVRDELEDAVMQDDMAQLERLVQDNPQSVNAQDEHGRTLLHFAATEGKAEAARVLLGNGAMVDARDNWGNTPLFLAIYEEPLVFERLPTVSLLIKNRADIHSRDDAGNTPLHMAAFGGVEVIDLLLTQGADVNAVNNLGNTPLHSAVQLIAPDEARRLLQNGAKSIRNAQGLTPLQIAEERGWTNLAELLSATFEREAVR